MYQVRNKMPLAAVILSDHYPECFYTCTLVCTGYAFVCLNMCLLMHMPLVFVCVHVYVWLCVHCKKTQPRSKWNPYSWWNSYLPFSSPPPRIMSTTSLLNPQEDCLELRSFCLRSGGMQQGKRTVGNSFFFSLSTTFTWKQVQTFCIT